MNKAPRGTHCPQCNKPILWASIHGVPTMVSYVSTLMPSRLPGPAYGSSAVFCRETDKGRIPELIERKDGALVRHDRMCIHAVVDVDHSAVPPPG